MRNKNCGIMGMSILSEKVLNTNLHKVLRREIIDKLKHLVRFGWMDCVKVSQKKVYKKSNP